MDEERSILPNFSKDLYFGYIIKGDLPGAIRYVKEFPEQTALYERFMAVFEREQYITYDTDAGLNAILRQYQRYYRDVFYLGTGKEAAENKLKAGLADVLGVREPAELSRLEQNQVPEAFQRKSFHFLGGRTSGYYGPYIWRTTETKRYEVELPDGIQTYTVKLLDGFISKSWPDYLSFGEIGTGGWTDGDGVINCIRSAYDFDSESFEVSLLKHEAQHAKDLAACPDMSSEDLEYRAKLVELIYSRERNLLKRFAREAGQAGKGNGHASASSRIMRNFARKLNRNDADIENLPNEQVRSTAKALYEESGRRN